MIIFQPKQQNKDQIFMMLVRKSIAQGRPTIVSTTDIRSTICRLTFYYPGALFVIMEDWGVKIYLRKPVVTGIDWGVIE